jgi:cellulose synthase/poly-beta-1,6-N-acetylglucosamine synthase-like glycosyltransferase
MRNEVNIIRNKSSMTLTVSVVVIGRNEGERLTKCIESVQSADWTGRSYELIYVDSDSKDGSLQNAEQLGAIAIKLDDPSPSAGKARNLGWRMAKAPFVLFLDGDTQLHPNFVKHALKVLDEPGLCATFGRLKELRPEKSIYIRVMDLDWVFPLGKALFFGGNVLVKRCAIAAVDGFDPTLKAGEEPELCSRLRSNGWQIEHIDVPMATHDLAITTFKAYWLRAYRSGIAYAEVAERMRLRGDPMWQHDAKRDFRHGLLFTLTPFFMWIHPLVTWMVFLASLAVVARTAKRSAWKAPGQTLLCWQYAVHVLFQKIPAFFGQLKWRRSHAKHAEISMVEYKKSGKSDGQQ